ncbi:NAC transcription factor 29 [Artemisia annua]|uniref:NAC transcription factor 29 n=1 Tax=Artemisia annua TaxID=35608 RepID=A0A2U1M1H0_ARTAN|nr:NAC transcription factor 29 [Artemisia annua]
MDPVENAPPHEMNQFQHDDVDVLQKLRSHINNEELNYYPVHQHNVYTTTPEILVGNRVPVEGKHYFLTERTPTRRGYVRKVDGGHWTGGKVDTIRNNAGNIAGYKQKFYFYAGDYDVTTGVRHTNWQMFEYYLDPNTVVNNDHNYAICMIYHTVQPARGA